MKRMEKSDPEFITPPNATTPLRITVPQSSLPLDGCTYLALEDNLEQLMRFCLECGSPISSVDKKTTHGAIVVYHFTEP